MRRTNEWVLGAFCGLASGGFLACSTGEQAASGDAASTTVVATRFEPIEPPEGFLECVGEQGEAQFGDGDFGSLPADDPPALVEVLPEVPPEELVASMKDIVNQCGGLDELPEQVLTQFQDEFGMSPEVASCVSDRLGADPLVDNFALTAVYGADSPQSQEQVGIITAVMMRCGRPDIEATLRARGAPDAVIDCGLENVAETIAAIEADPASHAEFTDEAANTAGAARCRAVLPPASASGTVSASAGAPLLRAAVADELIAVYGGDLDPTAASCIAGELVAALGLAASSTVTAADVAAYFEGAYSAEDLGTVLTAAAARALADAVVDCAGTSILRRTTLSDSNLIDALGRPEEGPAGQASQLRACSLEAGGTTELIDHLAEQFVDGPPSWASPSGRELIRVSFQATQRCADELGIPRLEPAP